MNFNNHGIIVPDISFWQDNDGTLQKVNFQQMKAAGAKGVILRAGQSAWRDEDFDDYRRDAKAAGLSRGYYWFYDSRSNPIHQANLWQALIGNDFPELGLWYDLEESYNGQYEGEKHWKTFVLAMDAFFPNVKTRGIYTAKWWWENQVVNDPAFWSAYPLWVAQYGVTQDKVVLPRPWLGKSPVFWQFTAHGDGTKYGVESFNIDLNYFNGDESQFNLYFNLPSSTGEPMPDYTELKPGIEGEYRSIRAQTTYPRPPHIVGTKIGQINANNSAKSLESYKYTEDILVNGEPLAHKDDVWWKVYEANGHPISGWVAERHLSRTYLTVIPPTTQPPSASHVVEVFVDGVQVFRKELS